MGQKNERVVSAIIAGLLLTIATSGQSNQTTVHIIIAWEIIILAVGQAIDTDTSTLGLNSLPCRLVHSDLPKFSTSTVSTYLL